MTYCDHCRPNRYDGCYSYVISAQKMAGLLWLSLGWLGLRLRLWALWDFTMIQSSVEDFFTIIMIQLWSILYNQPINGSSNDPYDDCWWLWSYINIKFINDPYNHYNHYNYDDSLWWSIDGLKSLPLRSKAREQRQVLQGQRQRLQEAHSPPGKSMDLSNDRHVTRQMLVSLILFLK